MSYNPFCALPLTRRKSHRFREAEDSDQFNTESLGYTHFARRYLGYKYRSLFLRVLRCFSSPSAHPDKIGIPRYAGRVSPFGHPRVIMLACQLLEAYRRLPRPS